ncbi:MAG: HAMP domain-containing sensor histidine kinase [Ilumatobacter sp.]|uniref:sensor histidine kinase n=1 Tax=Ilumatobacter sp. TaxID=1967498 RepID=UPI0032985353
MTRRRTFTLVVLALVLVFVLGSIATIVNTRRQMTHDIDRGLADDLDISMQLYNSFELAEFDELDAFDDLDVVNNPIATILVDPESGEVLVEVPAGPVDDPLARADLSTDRIVDGVGEIFTVDSTDDGPQYRAVVGLLDDGRLLALAVPLDSVDRTIRGLSRTLAATLVAMVTLLGVIIFILQRASFRPYDELIDTAEAIADGDMDRRAVMVPADPEIRRLTDSLNTMLDRLQQSLELRRQAEDRVKEFAADASHELRTPLTTIAGYSESYLLGAASDPEVVRKQMTRINSEALRMGRLVNDLLTLARLDQGNGFEARPVVLNSLVEDAVSDAHVTDPSHRVRFEPDHGRRIRVLGDGDALQQVVANLIANTRIHAPGANVEITVDQPDHAHAVVTVADDGPGMSQDIADHVFDRFFRAGESPAADSRSSGLGLSIVAAIVDTHGGTIDLDTTPGAGSRFTITLPTEAGPDPEPS